VIFYAITTMFVKFPYSASRRVMSRRPRRSKNGTPGRKSGLAKSQQLDNK
jgi:hypothetical protein